MKLSPGLAGCLVVCALALCLCPMAALANTPWYAYDCLTCTPLSPHVNQATTFDFTAVEDMITSVTPCSWYLTNHTLEIYAGDGTQIGWYEGFVDCGAPKYFDAPGVYSATVIYTYHTDQLVLDPEPGNVPTYIHQCIAPMEFTVVPEPSCLCVLAGGLAAVCGFRRRAARGF